MRKTTSGFTIIELLIVIVVIAILAAVTVVAFNGVLARADTSSRISELKAWEKQFKLYYAQEGKYPSMANGGYCLGTGFPNTDGSGIGNCRDTTTPATRYQVNTALNTELRKVGNLPSGPRNTISGAPDVVSPYVEYYSSTFLQLKTVIDGATCPVGTSSAYTYPNNRASICLITLPE